MNLRYAISDCKVNPLRVSSDEREADDVLVNRKSLWFTYYQHLKGQRRVSEVVLELLHLGAREIMLSHL